MKTTEPSVACPRCQHSLVDPAGLGWCQKCGYCRSLEEERAKAPLAAPEAPPPPRQVSLGGMVELAGALVKVPSWFWVLLAGMVMFILVSILPAKKLLPDSRERAIWSTLQMATGFLLIFASQFWALFVVAPEDERLGIRDLFFPTRLWLQVFKRLPALRLHVWLAGWGLALILSAIFLVGGLTYWLKYLPHNKTGQNTARIIR